MNECMVCHCYIVIWFFFKIGNRATNRSDDHPYLRPNPFMGHLHPGQVPALVKDSRINPSGALDLNGTMGTDPTCRPPSMTDVFPAGKCCVIVVVNKVLLTLRVCRRNLHSYYN